MADTVRGMRRHLLAHLAALEGTSAPLRAALMDTARVGGSGLPETGRRDLTVALLGNEQVDLGERVALLRAWPDVGVDALRAAPDGARGALAYAQCLTSVRHMVAACDRDDGTGVLFRHARAKRPDSTTLTAAILENRSAPDDVRRECALQLVSSYRSGTSDEDRVGNYVREHLAADFERGRQLAAQLVEASSRPRMRQAIETRVAYGPGGPPCGTWAWFSDPMLTAAQVSAWAHQQGKATAWLEAVRDFRDPSGQLAREAIAAWPRARWINERVVRTAGLPAHVREQAARALHEAGQRDWLRMAGTSSLLLEASSQFVTWFLDCGYGEHAADELARRPDIAAGDLERVTYPRAATKLPAPRALWLATHPCATGRTRALAAREAGPCDDFPASLAAAIAEHWAHDGRDVPARVAEQVPLAWFDDDAGRWSAPGVRAAVRAAGEFVAAQVRTGDQAQALVAVLALAPVTVAELVDLVSALTR